MNLDPSEKRGLLSRAAELAAEVAAELKRRLFEDRERAAREEVERDALLIRRAIEREEEREADRRREAAEREATRLDEEVEWDIHETQKQLSDAIWARRMAEQHGRSEEAAWEQTVIAAARAQLAILDNRLFQKHARLLGEQGIRPETLRSRQIEGALRAEAVDKLLAEKGQGERHPARDVMVRRSAFSGDRIERVVVVETPLEAIAYQQLHPEPGSHYIATGAPFGERAREVVAKELTLVADRALEEDGRSVPLVMAVSRSREGGDLGRQVAELAPPGTTVERLAPERGRDWLDDVKAREREFLRQQGIREQSRHGLGR